MNIKLRTGIEPERVEAAAHSLALAFEADPIMECFFSVSPLGKLESIERFFNLMLRVRIAMEMPVVTAEENGRILGSAMGYSINPPKWPKPFESEWKEFEKSCGDGLTKGLAAYESIQEQFRPNDPHYYLGVLGVHPVAQGKGVGGMLVEAFCLLADEDNGAKGVYLETANESSRKFYEKRNFVVVGEGVLDHSPVYCMYREDTQVIL